MNWPNQPQLWALFSICEDRWRWTYPALEIEREVAKMAEWCEANPAKAKRKRNWKRFIVNWLNRAQAKIEAAEARQMIEREQRRLDASAGRHL